jgi:hypothetical protein
MRGSSRPAGGAGARGGGRDGRNTACPYQSGSGFRARGGGAIYEPPSHHHRGSTPIRRRDACAIDPHEHRAKHWDLARIEAAPDQYQKKNPAVPAGLSQPDRISGEAARRWIATCRFAMRVGVRLRAESVSPAEREFANSV